MDPQSCRRELGDRKVKSSRLSRGPSPLLSFYSCISLSFVGKDSTYFFVSTITPNIFHGSGGSIQSCIGHLLRPKFKKGKRHRPFNFLLKFWTFLFPQQLTLHFCWASWLFWALRLEMMEALSLRFDSMINIIKTSSNL